MITQPATASAVVDPLEDVERLLAGGEHRPAWASMVRFLGLNPSSASCQAIAGLAARLDHRQADLVELRVAFLGNVTMDLFAPVHVARGLGSRMLVQPFVAEYDTWAQELLDPKGNLDRFDPHVVVLALHLDSLTPSLTAHFLDLDAAAVSREIEVTAQRIGDALRALRNRSKAKVLLHSFPMPVDRSLGVIDTGHPLGQTAALRALNARVASMVAELRDMSMWSTSMD
jgi:predicted enzyme involved in methoxymalonyl-ACP biosynthesis